jgi:cell division protein FtsI (penicillin-binding protein 3)
MTAPSTGRRRPAGSRRGGGLLGSPRRARSGVDGRIRLLRLAFLVFLVLVGGRAVALASSSQRLTQIAQDQQTTTVKLPAHRGSILDRNGAELAVGKPQQTVYADPHLLQDPKAAADELCDTLQINRRHARRVVEDALVDGKRDQLWFVYVARKVDPELARAALALDLPGVGSITEERRTYPLKAAAAQVLGFAGMENTGLAGMEMLYDKELSGKVGSETIVRDPAGHALKTVAHQEPESGQNVRLTLDSQIQVYAEDVLGKTLRDSGGKSAVAIVMDPRTGEVRAMANVSSEGFHGFGKGDQAAEKNRAVTDQYEPGSIFKLVTISGALADGTVTPDSTFTVPPSMWVADREIHDSHSHPTVTYSVREILQWSSNVGAVKIGIKMQKPGLARWIDAFGFGKTTGIEFPGEGSGSVLPVDKWSDSSIGNIPMGQGIAVTPIQMAVAFSAVANNGWAVRPRLVAQVGTKVYDRAVDKHRVIPGKVAREVRDMLALAVAEGTGTNAQIPGYEVAGKTGTAEIPVTGGYAKGVYVASFIGMVPADHPRLVVLCAVNGTPKYGGEAAAPAVKEIMQYALQRLEIAP